jgi:hypothetical protein
LEEEWRPIKGYEGLYEVSNTGKIRSLHYGKKEYYPKIDSHEGITTLFYTKIK